MKNITKTLLVILTTSLMITSQAFAQGEKGGPDKEKIMAEKYANMQKLKIAYITKHLDLTVEEAEKFWPVYNRYEAARNEITSDLFKQFERPDQKEVELTDDKALELITQRLKEERALVELKFKSLNEYLEVIPATKVYKLFEVENNFRRHLMDRIKVRDEERRKSAGERGSRGKPEK